MVADMKENDYPEYSPMYFLASLGCGGLSVSFFIYLMFMVPHEETPMATYNHIVPFLSGDNPVISLLIIIALLGIVYFALQHFKLLVWNLREYRKFKKTKNFELYRNSNEEVSLMAIPLTLAMSVNVFFVIGAVFVPNLWELVEYLFPIAIVAFLLVGAYAIRIFVGYYTRFIYKGDFDFDKNNNLSQTLGTFTFAMIAVGLAGPGAMSTILATSAFASFFSIMFATFAALLGLIKLILGMKSILEKGISTEASPTLWMFIPISTLIGITGVRLISGFYHNFLKSSIAPAIFFAILSFLIGVQIYFWLIGFVVMKRNNYFNDYVYGKLKSPGSYSLICPGVAFFVLGMFFIFYGLVKTGVVEIFSPMYFFFVAILFFVQFKTIHILFVLNRKLLPKKGSLIKNVNLYNSGTKQTM